MPNHDIDPLPRRSRRTQLRAAALAAATGACTVALMSGTAFASTSGGAAAPTGDQQTTASQHKKKKRHHVKLPKILKKIAMCESGGDPRAVSPSGKYRGKYQFDMETWRSVGGKGDPAKAPEWYQDKLALKLYRKRGTAPWPNCA